MKNENYFISQYENWTSVLRRIKEDEQRWISVLFLLYGAILFFQISKQSEILQFKNDNSYSLIGLLLVLIVNLIITLTWGYQSMNLRFQYYRSLIEVTKLRKKFGERLEIVWFENDFVKWRNKVTRPFESKIVDFILLSGLSLISGILAIFRYGGFTSCNSNLAKLFDFRVIIFVILFSFITAIPLIVFNKYDKNKLEKIYKTQNLPFKK